MGKSIGSPTEGHLVGGAHLAEAPYLRYAPAYAAGDVHYGLGALVLLIDRSARAVRRQFPDAVLSVGHLSRQGGGELDRHASHESGRDADVGFYVRSQTKKPLLSDHFVPFTGDGTAPSWPGAYFDDAKNWALVAALVSEGSARVTHIFVATPLRARLLAHAEKIGAPLALRVRASEVMAQPHGSLPHDDHFHVRIACPPSMDKCVEDPTLPHLHARAHVPHAKPHSGIPRAPTHPPAQAPPSAPPAAPDAPPAMLGVPQSSGPDQGLIDDVDGPL
jgi:penicillin-insensitive murein endopeptidase